MLLAVAIASGVWAYHYARGRRAAIEYVKRTGGRIQFAPRAGYLPEWMLIPDWMQSIEGIGLEDQVRFDLQQVIALQETESLYLTGRITFAGIQPIRKLQKLKHVTMHRVKGDQAGRALGECRHLESISSYDASVSDEDLPHLAKLPLKRLIITYADVTDVGLKSLEASKLEKLILVQAQITDAGMKSLRHMRSLNSLNLYGAQITNEGLLQLRALPLTELSLMQTDITDRGLPHLTALPLETLDLRHTAVTPQGLRALKGMKTLKVIYVRSPDFTEGKVSELRGEGLPVTLEPEV